MAAQHYNSCPFMAMKSTKLKHFNLDDKKKKGGISLPSCSFFYFKKKKCTPSLLLVLFIPKKNGGNDLLPVNTILPDFFFLAFLFSSPRLAPLSNTYVLRQQHKARHRSLKRPKFFFYQIKFKIFFYNKHVKTKILKSRNRI